MSFRVILIAANGSVEDVLVLSIGVVGLNVCVTTMIDRMVCCCHLVSLNLESHLSLLMSQVL